MTSAEISRRARARRLAMQAIYQIELTSENVEKVLEQFHANESFENADKDYFNLLVTESVENRDALTKEITRVSDTDFATVDAVERALILIGACEILYIDDISKAVAISEAVRLAKKFGASGGHRFVNGVLDKL